MDAGARSLLTLKHSWHTSVSTVPAQMAVGARHCRWVPAAAHGEAPTQPWRKHGSRHSPGFTMPTATFLSFMHFAMCSPSMLAAAFDIV